MDILQIFEELAETSGITTEQKQLLNRLMSLQSPVEFDFATDEEMDALEDAMDRAERDAPNHIRFKETTYNIRAKVAESDTDFI